MASAVGTSKQQAATKNDTFVEAQIDRARRRIRMLDLTTALLGLFAGVLAFGVVMALLDYWFTLPDGVRLAAFLGFLLPLVAIALGFDAINGEHARRTMSRLLAQPIYRDAVLFGKFLGGLLIIAIALLTLWLLMMGLGILFLGLPPSGGELARLVVEAGGSLKSLELRRARLDEAYDRYFKEVADAA